MYVLDIVPIKASGTKKSTGTLVIEAASRFLITRNVRDQGLSLWRNPVNDCAFHALGFVCPSTVNVFLNLLEYFRE